MSLFRNHSVPDEHVLANHSQLSAHALLRLSEDLVIILAMPQTTTVEVVFCLRNIDRASFEALKAVAAQNPEIRLVPAGCLCNCTRCVDVPFLQINGRIIEGATHASILEEVRSALHA